jgi:tetratricopeptide (TPR) repeat protein
MFSSRLTKAGSLSIACAFALGLFRLGCPEAAVAAGADSGITEQNDRTVDEAALELKRDSLTVLDRLARKKAGTEEELEFQLRRADLLMEISQLEFRTAHGRALRTRKPADLSAQRKSLARLISLLSEIIVKFPRSPSLAKSIYLRAKSYRELGRSDEAAAELKDFVKRFPGRAESPFAFQALAELLFEKKDYSGTLEYLKPLMGENSPFRQFAYDKASLCHYYANDITEALRLVATAVSTNSAGSVDGGGAADQHDALLKNAALFFFTGFERKLPGYGWENALDAFRKIGSGAGLGTMVIQFSLLLRSKGYSSEYTLFSGFASKGNAISRYGRLELLLSNVDYFKGRQAFQGMLSSVDEVFALARPENGSDPASPLGTKAKNAISTASAELQSRLGPDPASFGSPLGTALASLYEKMSASGLYSRQETAGIHFNLAELRFAQRDFGSADKFYHLALEAESPPEARIKAVSARTEKLRSKHILPDALRVVSLQQAKAEAIDPEAGEWLGEIGKLSEDAKNRKSIAPFRFAGLRYMYSRGRVKEALPAIEKLIRENPDSSFAMPALSLLLDTYLASSEWDKCRQIIVAAKEQEAWKRDLDLQRKLERLEASIAEKQVSLAYQNKEFGKVMKAGLEITAQSHFKPEFGEILAMAANAAIATGDERLAQKFFTELKQRDGSRKGLAEAALSLDISVAEKEFSVAKASDLLLELLKTGRSRKDSAAWAADRRKLLLYAWLGGKGRVQAALKAGVCRDNPDTACQLAQARSFILPVPRAGNAPREIPELEVARGIASLERRNLPPEKALPALEALAVKWKEMDPLSSYAFLPRIDSRLKPLLAAARTAVSRRFPIRMDKNAIQGRVAASARLDEQLEKLSEGLPFAGPRKTILAQRAGIYEDLAKEVRRVPPPAALRGADLSVFEQGLREIALPFERRQAEFGDRIEEAGRNSFCCDFPPVLAASSRFFRSASEKVAHRAAQAALEEKNPPLLAYLTKEAQSRGILSDGSFSLLAAAVSSSTGESGEALSLLEGASKEFDSPPVLLMALLRSYSSTGNSRKLRETAALLAASPGLRSLELSAEDEAALQKQISSAASKDLEALLGAILRKAGRARVPASRKEGS